MQCTYSDIDRGDREFTKKFIRSRELIIFWRFRATIGLTIPRVHKFGNIKSEHHIPFNIKFLRRANSGVKSRQISRICLTEAMLETLLISRLKLLAWSTMILEVWQHDLKSSEGYLMVCSVERGVCSRVEAPLEVHRVVIAEIMLHKESKF